MQQQALVGSALMWIRGPAWDGTWILSGIPIGIALAAVSPPLSWTFAFFFMFRTAHVISPIVLAWSHDGFRQIMLRHRVKFIVVPTLIFGVSTAVGAYAPHIQPDSDPYGVVRLGLKEMANPAAWLATTYFVWNAWHFGMQNFGVLRLYSAKTGRPARRGADKTFCLLMIVVWTILLSTRALIPPAHAGAVAFGCCAVAVMFAGAMLINESSGPRALFIIAMASPIMVSSWSLWYAFATIYLNHWLVAIGLAAHVYGAQRKRSQVSFAAAVMIAGVAVFAVLDFAAALGASLGLSFVHFLYDRWVYKFNDPQVRATIGNDLCGRPAGGQQTSLASEMRRPNAILKAEVREPGEPDV